ncbi:MAG: WbqC family protein, partial [Muribaculaceae bacterium]|nr:WbqC family protein [Muribaculaceae bacterium]
MTPYTLHPGTTVILEPRYYGSIAWYAAAAACEHSLVAYDARHDKRRKLTHRTTIADVNGPLDLTMPLSSAPRPVADDRRHLTWNDMALSPHGEWWNVHRVALESAYGRTPYFEYYIDRFLPALTPGVIDRFVTLRDIDAYIDSRVRELLDLPPAVTRPEGTVIDLSRTEPGLIADAEPYYQVRARRLGFIPG